MLFGTIYLALNYAASRLECEDLRDDNLVNASADQSYLIVAYCNA